MVKKNTKTNKNAVEWYDNPNIITTFIIGLIGLIILLSQSFAIKNNLSPLNMLGSILNHNILYLLVGIYFIALKTKVGKRYFDFLNMFLIILYILEAITSLLTVFQSFGLASLLIFSIDILILIYLFHTMLRNTALWKSAGIDKSPFNEITNSGYFSTIVILAITLLAVDLVSSTSLDGTILSLLDASFTCLFVRYIFLYGDYLDSKKIAVNNEGNFNEIKELISNKVDNFVDEHDLDDKFDKLKDKVDDVKEDIKDVAGDIRDTFVDVADDLKIEEKFNEAKEATSKFVDSVSDNISDVKEKIVKKYEESDLDEKVDKVKEVVNEITEEVKEEMVEIKEEINEKIEESGLDDKIDKAKVDAINKINEVKEKISSKPKSEITSRKKSTKKKKIFNKKETK